MISLAGRDILHAWGKFVFTGIGLGLLIGVTLTMAGVYRSMVDDAQVLLDNSAADLWVVQKDTLGPYAESIALRRQGSWVRIPPSAPFPFKISMLQLLVLVKKAPRVPPLKSRGHFLLVSRADVMTSARLVAKITVF